MYKVDYCISYSSSSSSSSKSSSSSSNSSSSSSSSMLSSWKVQVSSTHPGQRRGATPRGFQQQKQRLHQHGVSQASKKQQQWYKLPEWILPEW